MVKGKKYRIKLTIVSIRTGHCEETIYYHLYSAKFYILLTVHLEVILVNDQLDALFLNVFISRLYMLRATIAHHQEDQPQGLSGYRARRRVVDSRGPVLVAGLSLNK
jgi:hypothetical protein